MKTYPTSAITKQTTLSISLKDIHDETADKMNSNQISLLTEAMKWPMTHVQYSQRSIHLKAIE